MRTRLLTKKNSSWSTFEELTDAAHPLEKELFDNLGLETAYKPTKDGRKQDFSTDEFVDMLFRTQIKKLPQLKPSKNHQNSRYMQKKQLNTKSRCQTIKDEADLKKAKDFRRYSMMNTEASWNTSISLASLQRQQSLSQIDRKKLRSLYQKQRESFQSTYGSTNFQPSQVQTGPIFNETPLTANLTVNQFVALKWDPIRSHQFSKLTRKDIMPLPHDCTKARSKRIERRMAYNIKKQVYVRYPISYIYPVTGKTN